jgi:type IV pilus assembly protein PilE
MKNRRIKGFTLIEMMIVVVIISILSAVATASYRSYVVKARRTSAQEELLQIQQAIEEFYALNHTYNGAYTTNVKEQYQYSFTVAGAGSSFSGYQLRAEAQGGQKSSDSDCAVLFLNRNGTKGGGTSASTMVQGNCW